MLAIDPERAWELASPEPSIEDLNPEEAWNQATTEPPDVKEAYPIVKWAEDQSWQWEAAKATGKQIAKETAEMWGPIAKGEFDFPTALIETVKGLGLGMLGFADEQLTRLSTEFQMLASKGEIDWAEVDRAGKIREQLYSFEPKDPLAHAALSFVGAIPLGIEKAAEVLADQFENPNIKAALKTAGWFGSLRAFGEVFKTAKAPFKPKEAVKIPARPEPFEKFMREEAAKKLAREEKAITLREARRRRLAPEFEKELREVEPIEKAVPEMELPAAKEEVRLRKGWQAVKPITEEKMPEVFYKKGEELVKREELAKKPPSEELIRAPRAKEVEGVGKARIGVKKGLEVKEPWEMTSKEFEKDAPTGTGFVSETGKQEKIGLRVANKVNGKIYIAESGENHGLLMERTTPKAANIITGYVDSKGKFYYSTPDKYFHKLEVQQALKEGKAVPPEVLKEYPKLEAKAEKIPEARVEKEKGLEVKKEPLAKKISLMPDTKKGMYDNFILEDKEGKIYEGDVGEHMQLAEHFKLKPENIKRFGIVKETGEYSWKETLPSHIEQWKEISRMRARGEPEAVAEEMATKPRPGKEVTLDLFGFQTGYERAAKWRKAVKQEREVKVREAVTQSREDFLTPVKGNPLDKGAIAFMKSEKYPDYLKEMPAIGDLSPKEIFRYDPAAKKNIATIITKEGNLKPAIRQSGFHALKEFSDSFTGAKDISKLSSSWADPTRMIQELDQGRFGGMAQKHILWPARMTTLSKLRWCDIQKARLNELIEKHNLNSGKKQRAAGDVLEYVDTEKVKMGSRAFLLVPEVRAALKKFKDPVKMQIIDFCKEMRTFSNELRDAQNQARKLRKQKDIPYRSFYRTWIMETNLWSKLSGMRMKPKEIMESPEMPDFIFANQPFNPRAEARTGLLAKYPKERNIVKLFSDYIETAGKDIFDTNVIHNNKIHSAVLRSIGLENAAEGINKWTAEVFAGVKPRITKAATEILPRPIHKGMLKIRRMLTRAVFPLNWTWNLFIQTSSAGITYARYGNKANLAGLKYFFDPVTRRSVRQNSYSYIIKSRWGGRAHYQDIQNSIMKNKKLEAKPIHKVEEFLNFLTSSIEEGLTGHAIAAAEHHGRTKLGLKGRELWEYASEGGAKTQSMYNYGDVPGMLRAREVGAIFPFQTFSFEVFNTVREMNIPGLRKLIGKTGLYETLSADSVAGKALMSNRLKMLARWTAAIIVTDAVGEKAIGRKPWVISSFVPFIGWILGGFAGKGPVPAQYIQDAKKGIRDIIVYEDFKRLRKWLLRYHMIAGVQIERTIEGIEAIAKGGRVEDIRGRLLYRIPPEEFRKAIAMGPGRTETGKEYYRKWRESRSTLRGLKERLRKEKETIR